MWGRGHCTTAHFFLQGEAALCKASPFTTKLARVGKPSPRRSPWQTSTSQREGGSPFPENRPVFIRDAPRRSPGCFPGPPQGGGDTVVTKSFLCARFCALWAAHTMPTNPFFVGVFRHFRCGKGPFLAGRVRSLSCGVRGLSRASTGLCARVCVSFPECPGTPRVKRFQTARLFSMGGGADIGWEKENDFPLFSPQNRRCFAGSQSRFPFSCGKDPRQTIRSELLFA